VFGYRGLATDLKSSLLDPSAAFNTVGQNILLQLLLNGESSSHTEVNYEAPQASVQRPDLFTLYVYPLLLVKLPGCLRHIMSFNFLLLSSDRTEVIVTGRKNLRNTVANTILTLDGIALSRLLKVLRTRGQYYLTRPVTIAPWKSSSKRTSLTVGHLLCSSIP
uniref:Uncharacterized protein n=1 Tax=Maylandia zebra TaxID=106582 RepID=A0A3P9DP95_9CICH